MNNIFVILPAIAILLSATIPMAFASSHESNSKRSSDGFNDGSNAARSDTSFNPACDPQSLHTSDGQHTATYCNAWTDGYTSTWNSLHSASGTTTTQQTQQQTQLQQQSQRGVCIAISCNQNQGRSQGESGAQGQSTQP